MNQTKNQAINQASDDIIRDYLRLLMQGEILSQSQSEQAFSLLLQGGVADILVASFLTVLHSRGEQVCEIAGAAQAMRSVQISLSAPEKAIDVVGTGGDAKGSLNISTAVAFVVAGAGVVVAKHGNRAVTSHSGAADVLEFLGVNIEADYGAIEKALVDIGIGFLFARRFHPSLRHITPVRQALGVRTIFNILGPLCNPAGVKRLLMGVYDERLLRPMAEVAVLLGVESIWVVHGADGLDELSTTGVNRVCSYGSGEFREFSLSPDELGLSCVDLVSIQGGSVEYNASRLESLLSGECDSYRDIVVLNSAAAFVMAGKCSDLREGRLLAEESIDSGSAGVALDSLRNFLRV